MRTRTWKDSVYGHEADYHVLTGRVMTFAVANRSVGDWTAYIDVVPGENHDEEFDQLLAKRSSTKLSYDIAKIIFPYFDDKYVWRD